METDPIHPGWRIQLAIHRAVRRDISRLVEALGRDRDLEAEVLLAYWTVVKGQLHHHHVLEDTVIWPLLGERMGDQVGALLARNEEEHRMMARAMDGFDASLRTMTADATSARAALGELQAAVGTHLDHEEADVLPLIPEAFTMEDIAYFRAEDQKTNAPDVFLPWMLDEASEDDVAFFVGAMPPSVREILQASWMPRWLETVDTLRRPASAPTIA